LHLKVEYFYATLLVLVNSLCLFLVVLGMPGTWLMVVATALLAWWRWEVQMFSLPVLMALVLLAAVGELLEFLAGLFGAKKPGPPEPARAGPLSAALSGASLLPRSYRGRSWARSSGLVRALLLVPGSWKSELHERGTLPSK